jgi:hypothetical protein
MIEVEITQQMKRSAWRKAYKLGKLKNSITSGKGNIVGFLGEEVANSLIQGEFINSKDYDIIKNKIKIDVKTKQCTSVPQSHYECSVAAFNTQQKCDIYVFVRIEKNKNKWGRAWVLGWMYKEEYFEKSKKLIKGQSSGDNWFKVKANCFNLEISELNKMEDLIRKLK